jgi:hypothetical protein
MIIKKELEYIEEDKSKNKNSNWETVAIIWAWDNGSFSGVVAVKLILNSPVQYTFWWWNKPGSPTN